MIRTSIILYLCCMVRAVYDSYIYYYRMRLNEYHILKIFVDDFMRNSNFGIGVLHVKVKY